jgi:nigerose phosphorylase
MRRGNVYQLANGYMGYRGTLDEFGPDEAGGHHARGPLRPRRLGVARTGQRAQWRFHAGVARWRRTLRPGPPGQGSHRQTLHFRQCPVRAPDGLCLPGEDPHDQILALPERDTPNLGVVVAFSLTCDQAAKVTIRTGIDGNIWDLNGPHLPQLMVEKQRVGSAGVRASPARTCQAGGCGRGR